MVHAVSERLLPAMRSLRWRRRAHVYWVMAIDYLQKNGKFFAKIIYMQSVTSLVLKNCCLQPVLFANVSISFSSSPFIQLRSIFSHHG